MLELLTAILAGQNASAPKRQPSLLQGLPVVWIALTAGLALVALGFLAVALWFALAPPLGPAGGALAVALIAGALAALASIPLWRNPEPEPNVAATLLELALALGAGLLAERKLKPSGKARD